MLLLMSSGKLNEYVKTECLVGVLLLYEIKDIHWVL